MPTITLYHNPRCSKSRQCLALLQEKGLAIEVVAYLEKPLNAATLKALIERSGEAPMNWVRRNEDAYTSSGLKDMPNPSVMVIAKAIAAYPKLMQRPVVVCDEQVLIARPPEKVLTLLAPAVT